MTKQGTLPTECENGIQVKIGTGAGSVASGEFLTLEQKMEGDRIAGTNFGAGNAQPLSASFDVQCNFAGTFHAALIMDPSGGRSLIHPFTFLANTPTAVSFSIPGDTSGAWLLSGNTQAMEFDITLSAGSSFQTSTIDAWQAVEKLAQSSQTQMAMTTGATCFFSTLKLEISPAPTAFIRQQSPPELDNDQYYYEKSYPRTVAPGTFPLHEDAATIIASAGAGPAGYYVHFHHSKLCTPTITIISSGTGTSGKIWDAIAGADVAVSAIQVGVEGFMVYGIPVNPASPTVLEWHWTATCQLVKNDEEDHAPRRFAGVVDDVPASRGLGSGRGMPDAAGGWCLSGSDGQPAATAQEWPRGYPPLGSRLHPGGFGEPRLALLSAMARRGAYATAGGLSG